MDIESILSDSVIQEANLVIQLQNILCKINEENFESSLITISSSVFIQSTEAIHQLGHNIFTIIDNMVDKAEILFSLVLNLSRSLKEPILKEFKIYFIHNFITGQNDKQFISSLARYKFIRLCCESNFIEVSEIINEIKYWFEYIPQQKSTHFKLLLWFADYIKLDVNLFEKMSKEIFRIDKSKYPNDLLSAYDDFKKIEKQDKNFDKIIYLSKNYYPQDSIQHYIKNDMLNEFCFLTSNTDFNLHTTVQVSFYDPHRFLHHSITYICFAAFYGSIKIFKHLLAECQAKNIDISVNDMKRTKLMYYAICGGNFEIIRLVFSERSDSNKSPKYAALYFQNSVFNWLLDNPTSDLQSIIHACCQVNNIEIFLEMLRQGSNITELHKGLAPIHYAALNGHCDILKILLTLPYVDVNCVTSDNETPLQLAVKGRQYDAVRFLLSQKNINVNCQSKPTYHTPLHLATRESDEDIVKLLLADKRIKVMAINFVLFLFFLYE